MMSYDPQESSAGSPTPRFMPVLMGPASAGGVARYARVDAVAAQWRVHANLLAGLLPDCFVPLTDGPDASGLLTVAFADNQGVDFMAGRGYRVASVLVRAAFQSQNGPVGDFVVAMFEDDCLPIVLGRELLGMPKLFADISIEDRPDSSMACEASLWGHMLFSLETGPLEPREQLPEPSPDPPSLLGMRSFPDPVTGSLVGEPLLTPVESRLREMALGSRAEVTWGLAGPAEVACVAGLLDALRTLAVDEPVLVGRTVMSRVLRTDQIQRLAPPCPLPAASL
jgi:hypothetical protein